MIEFLKQYIMNHDKIQKHETLVAVIFLPHFAILCIHPVLISNLILATRTKLKNFQGSIF